MTSNGQLRLPSRTEDSRHRTSSHVHGGERLRLIIVLAFFTRQAVALARGSAQIGVVSEPYSTGLAPELPGAVLEVWRPWRGLVEAPEHQP